MDTCQNKCPHVANIKNTITSMLCILLCLSVLSARAQQSKERLDSVIKSLDLKEVVVTAKKIRQRGDTISYSATTYLNKNDKTLADLLNKMPGIEVKSDGQVMFNGQWIKEFYIEGLDMLGDNYGTATKNIDAKAIGAVQVLERHQDAKILQGTEQGDAPAMNIVLKNSAKGVWTGMIDAAGGYQREAAWNGSATIMNFRKNTQSLIVAKSNNTGNEIRKEIGASGTLNPGLGTDILVPGSPSVPQSYSYLNRSASGSLNQLFRTGSEQTLTFNLNYLYDREERNATDRTEYLLDDITRYVFDESNNAVGRQNFIGCNSVFKSNRSGSYLKNSFSATLMLPRASGIINDQTTQRLAGHSAKVSDVLNFKYKRPGGGVADASMRVGFTDSKGTLTFGDPATSQTVWQRSVSLNGSASVIALSIPHLMFNLNCGLTAGWQQSRSSLEDQTEAIAGTARTWNAGLNVNPRILWYLGEKFQWLTYIPVGIIYYGSDNFGFDPEPEKYDKAFLSLRPYSSIIYKPSNRWTLSMIANCTESLPSPLSLSIQKRYLNYRSTISNPQNVEARQSRTIKAAADVSFKSVLDMIFANISFSGIFSSQPNSFGYEIADGIVDYFVVDKTLKSRTYQIDQSASKGFFKWNSKISESLSLGTSGREYIIGDELHNGRTDYLRAALSYTASFTRWLSFETSNQFTLSKSHTDGRADDRPRNTFSSTCSLTAWPTGNLGISPSVMYHYNDFSTDYRNNVFLNCRIEYILSRVTLTLQCQNLLDNRVFRRFSDNGIIRHSGEYRLRGRLFLLGAMFRI